MRNETPIENTMHVAIQAIAGRGIFSDVRFIDDWPITLRQFNQEHMDYIQGFETDQGPTLLVCREVWVADDIRVDFFLAGYHYQLRHLRQLVVECDGHQWHYGDREKIEADNRRYRRLTDLQLPFYRYEGGLIQGDSRRVSAEIERHFFDGFEQRRAWEREALAHA